MVAKSSRRVRKLCTGAPCGVRRVAALRSAADEGVAGATTEARPGLGGLRVVVRRRNPTSHRVAAGSTWSARSSSDVYKPRIIRIRPFSTLGISIRAPIKQQGRRIKGVLLCRKLPPEAGKEWMGALG